jgi:branched-chain amino acid transport system substrate-binding protein
MIARILLAGVMTVAATAAFAEDKPIKIGWMMGYTGPGATVSSLTDAAIQAYLKKYGSTMAGRKVEIIRRDTTGPAPDVAKRLAQELVVGEKVDFLAGVDYTANAMAMGPVATATKTPLLIVASSAAGLTSKIPYGFRFGYSVNSYAKELAAYAAKEKFKNVYTMVVDIGPGIDAETMFIREYKGAGGAAIAGSVRVPMKAVDFSAYIQRIKDAAPDAVFVFMAAGETPSIFLRQFKEAGLDKTTKILGTGDVTDETNLAAAGDAALGVVTAFNYTPTHNSAMNKEFLANFEQFAPGKPANFAAVAAYDIFRAINDVVTKQNGKLDPEKTVELLKQVKFESPRGPIEIDPATRDAVQNIYLRKVEKVGGKLVNVEFATMPNVKDPGSTQ